jgi:hypothetical protein
MVFLDLPTVVGYYWVLRNCMIGCSKCFCDALGARTYGYSLQKMHGDWTPGKVVRLYNTVLGGAAVTEQRRH